MGIDRGTVLNLINDVHRAGGFKDYNSYSYLFDQVDTMPESKEDAEPHWIPVTERLPETEGRYIVVNSKIGAWHVDIDFYRPYMGGWMYDQGVLAWMPLPEPYKGVTE